MGAVRLGRISLRWCRSCNVPIVEEDSCAKCNAETEPVSVTPPGDYRPAFDFDIARIRRTISSQFGEKTGLTLIPEGRLVVLNKCPAVDGMDEVIVDGQILGSHMFEPDKGWKFICRLEGAHRISGVLEKSWTEIYDDAAPFIKEGKSTMAVGVLDADKDIKIGDEIIVISEDRTPISTGRARMSGQEMIESSRGPAVKTRWYKDVEIRSGEGKQTWQDAVEANARVLEKRVKKAEDYVHRTIKRFDDLDVAVSFSGGKDSLATLHLVLGAGVRPKLIFTDTGLEFPETIENVKRTAKKFSLELIIEDAGDAFWSAMEYFGPPAKDFRWCCKTCKLGPTSCLIREHFPNGVLSFIGQRQYESAQRFEKGNIWRNPWVPGQVGASPIQHWPSLLVWLYIFREKAEYNPLYEKGMERIGCRLCPSADMAEFENIDDETWRKALTDFAERHDLPEEWVSLGLWRWKVLPKGVADYLERAGMSELADRCRCESAFNDIDIGRLAPDEKERVERFSCITDDTQPVIRKALYCVGCGICISRCESGALELKDGRVEIEPEKCIGCGNCLHPCTVIDFSPR